MQSPYTFLLLDSALNFALGLGILFAGKQLLDLIDAVVRLKCGLPYES